MAGRVDLDGNPIEAMTICMIGAGGFIGSHLCEKLMAETPHTVLAVDVYSDKIKHLLDPPAQADHQPSAGRIQFHRLNIKNDSRLEGLIKMADLTINLAAICTPADYNTRPLDTIYSNFIDALPVVKYCSENGKRLIHFSTCEIYGKTIGSFLPRDHPLRQVIMTKHNQRTWNMDVLWGLGWLQSWLGSKVAAVLSKSTKGLLSI
ncbi:UDP-D-apiose/UDP-D-xylose synthase 2-like [Canna indica]|uniref:UDP-D-apiose/UDP-D-xylose synthase 2-like n=1 Tax=Canna indica TaxID=4628 RepID=A0AAQ3K7Q4_9LILI|nr:UDP-D-apiose/UDP-D-xylose synthase 2-like [Canna indica]